MRKKSLFSVIAIVVIVCFALVLMCGAGVLTREEDTAAASAEPGLQVTGSEEIVSIDPVLYVNDECIDACMLISGEPYVDIAAFCDALGLAAAVSGDGVNVVVNDNGVALTAEVGARYLVCNERYFYLADGVCQIDGKPAVSVELLADLLGVSAQWDTDANVITVLGDSISPVLNGSRVYDDNDLYWLSRFIYAEAGDEDLDTQVALAQLVLNRVDSELYAEDNIYDVIFSKNQFDAVINGMIYMTPDEQAEVAAKLALEGADLVGNATEFCVGTQESSLEFVIQIGSYRFYGAA